jgi:putative zinc finger/helix-turn-helix YgiT family protein
MKTENSNLCPTCDAGQLREQRIDYSVTAADGVKVVVPNLLVEICDHCGEIILSADAADTVDAAIAEQTEQLTVRELERIREDLGVDQTEMSEILGLGDKTYHRWEKGNQVPSRSMGYYLRALAEFPMAFAWLRGRGWRRRNRLAPQAAAIDFGTAFPDLTATQHAPIARAVPRYNPARAFFGKAA